MGDKANLEICQKIVLAEAEKLEKDVELIKAMSQPTSLTTQCIHANPHKDQYGAVIMPIYQTSTFQCDSAEEGGSRFEGKPNTYTYTRFGNPTISCLEGKIAALEHAEDCVAFSSGMAAITTVFWTLLNSGDHVIADETLYGCTLCFLKHHLPRFNVEVSCIDTSIPGEVTKALRPNTKIVYFETPANPTLKIVDIKRLCEEAHKQEGVLVVTDNTFSSPVVANPLKLGVDIVVHSATKYLNGHSDVVAGLACSTKKICYRLRCLGLKDITGAVLSPHDAYLITRGLMTLELRVLRACENAMKVARFLANHDAISKVYYPGLETHPGHEIAKQQMTTFGSMITFELKGGLEAGKKFLNHLKLMTLAVSLGGCESLIQHPASMTHACCKKEERERAGISDGMVRLSVGIEGIDDIINDLKQSLDCLSEIVKTR